MIFITIYLYFYYTTYMKEKEIVLEAMKNAWEPVNAWKVAELTGLDRKVVDKVFAQLKKEWAIVVDNCSICGQKHHEIQTENRRSFGCRKCRLG